MNIKSIIKFIFVAGIIVGVGYFINRSYFSKKTKPWFKTQKPEKRDIKQEINASGELEVKDNIKVGSLVSGVVQSILVEENDKVTKGQLLALIDNGKDNTEVQEAQGVLDRAQAVLDYQTAFFARQHALHQSGQVSDDTFEKAERDLRAARASVLTAQGTLTKKQIEYNNLRIVAPDDGIIVNVGISQGQRVTTDLDATVLFEMGKDISSMQGNLEIDESDIGQLTKGQSVKFSVDTYMDLLFRGTVTQIGYSPTIKNGNKFYTALVDVDNSKLKLRPGMTINANIRVAKAKNTLAVTSQVFQINTQALEFLAKKHGYSFEPLLPEKKKRLDRDGYQFQTKFIWVLDGKRFVEKPIKIDITDDIYFEVKSGLDETDNLLIDIDEPDEMAKVYKKWFKGAL